MKLVFEVKLLLKEPGWMGQNLKTYKDCIYYFLHFCFETKSNIGNMVETTVSIKQRDENGNPGFATEQKAENPGFVKLENDGKKTLNPGFANLILDRFEPKIHNVWSDRRPFETC